MEHMSWPAYLGLGARVVAGRAETARRLLGQPRIRFRTATRPLCVRHLLGLRALDTCAGHVTARGAVESAEMLIPELNEAFGKNTWARRHEARARK